MTDALQFLDGIFKQGFGIIRKIVMRDKRLSIEAKAIYAYICSFAGAGGTAFPSVDLICSELGISKGRFFRHKKQLELLGYIEVTRKREKGKLSKNIYKIISSPESPYTQNQHTENQHVDFLHVQNQHVENAHTNNNNFNNTSNNNTPYNPPTGERVCPSKHEEKLEEKESSNSKDFEEFWKAYPRKQAKKKAFEVWKRLKKAKALPDLETLLSAIDDQKIWNEKFAYPILPSGSPYRRFSFTARQRGWKDVFVAEKGAERA